MALKKSLCYKNLDVDNYVRATLVNVLINNKGGWIKRNFSIVFIVKETLPILFTDRVPPMTSCEDKICGNFY